MGFTAYIQSFRIRSIWDGHYCERAFGYKGQANWRYVLRGSFTYSTNYTIHHIYSQLSHGERRVICSFCSHASSFELHCNFPSAAGARGSPTCP